MAGGPKYAFWPSDKHTLNVCFLNGDRQEQSLVRTLVRKHFNPIPMRIRFTFLSRSPSDIRILFADDSMALIGRTAENWPDMPTMWLDVHPKRNSQDAALLEVQADVLHEFGHALGLVHEHKNPQFEVEWNLNEIGDRWGVDLCEVCQNYDRDSQYAVDASWDRPYDPKSIMHYAIRRGETQCGLMEVPPTYVLSEDDKETLAMIYSVV